MTSFAVSARPLVRALGCACESGTVAVWAATTLFGADGLRNTKYQMPTAPRKKRTNAATPPRISAIFAGVRPPDLGIGGSVLVVPVAGAGTLAVAVVGG